MRPIGLLAVAVAIVCLLPVTVGAQEPGGGRVFDVDRNPAPHLRPATPEVAEAQPDSGKSRFDEPSESAPLFPPPGIFAGTGDFGAAVTNPAVTVSEYLGTARQMFSGMPVWGAAYFESNRIVWFTTSSADDTDEDGSQLMAWEGGVPAFECILTTGGVPIRVDGLAADPATGTLFMAHQFGDTVGPAGIYAGVTCTDIALLVDLPGSEISGIAYDPVSTTLYGVDDASAQLVSIDTTTGVLTPIAAYPGGVTDIDGLAYGEGRLYLVPDDPTSGGILVYDLGTASYLDPLPAPWMNPDTFSGAAFVPGSIWGDGFESGDLSAWSSSDP